MTPRWQMVTILRYSPAAGGGAEEFRAPLFVETHAEALALLKERARLKAKRGLTVTCWIEPMEDWGND